MRFRDHGYSLVELLVAVSLLGLLISLMAGVHLFTARKLKTEATRSAGIHQAAMLDRAISQLAQTAIDIRPGPENSIRIVKGNGRLIELKRDSLGHVRQDEIVIPTPNLRVDTLVLRTSGRSKAILIAVSGDAGYIRTEIPCRKLSQWVSRHSPGDFAEDSLTAVSR